MLDYYYRGNIIKDVVRNENAAPAIRGEDKSGEKDMYQVVVTKSVEMKEMVRDCRNQLVESGSRRYVDRDEVVFACEDANDAIKERIRLQRAYQTARVVCV